jgi:hypothetical protein
MWINAALSGRAIKLDTDSVDALECAGLLMRSPGGLRFPGWVQHHVLGSLAGMPDSNWFGSRKCTSRESPDHDVAHQFCNLVRERIVYPHRFHVESPVEELFRLEGHEEQEFLRNAVNDFVNALQQLVASSPANRGGSLLRHPLPITIRDEEASIQIQQTVAGNRQRDSRARRAAELVSAVQKLTLFDSGSPGNGPVMWTIAYALLERPGGSSIPLIELVENVTTYLGSSQRGYVARIAQESIFRVVFSGDNVPAIELDFSGRGEAGPLFVNANLSRSPGLYRLEDSWIYDISDLAQTDGEFPIPLPLAVHLAILARSLNDEGAEHTVPAVVVIGERRGWLYLKPESLKIFGAKGNAYLRIYDNGSLALTDVVGLHDLIPSYSELMKDPTEMLRELGALLGMRILENSDDFPLPSVIRTWVRARGPSATSFDQQILDAAKTAQRQLEGLSDVHE